RIAPSSPEAPCSTGNTTCGGSSARRPSSSGPTSQVCTSTPRRRSASATRRPDRTDTSCSGDSPPASTSTRFRSATVLPSFCPCPAAVATAAGPLRQVGGRGLAAPAVRRGHAAEGVAQLDLALQHAHQAAHPLADLLGAGIAERQPHVALTAATVVE